MILFTLIIMPIAILVYHDNHKGEKPIKWTYMGEEQGEL